MTRSGKKERTVISCVTFEVSKVVDPICYYEATKAHIIHYVRDPEDPRCDVYRDFYDTVARQVKDKRGVDVIEHSAVVYDYQTMLKTILDIIESEKRETEGYVDIYVNISSGTSEYAAAAMVACMMVPEAIPFSVGTRNYTMDDETIRNVCYSEGEPVGLSRNVFDPKMVPVFDASIPDEELIAALMVMDELNRKMRFPSFNDIIAGLKKNDFWNYSPDSKKIRTDDSQKERVYFRRHYIDPMLEMGWIVEDDLKKNHYNLTSKGKATLEIFGIEK